MKKLDILQINNLMVGNTLAAEIPIEREGYKAFVVVCPHHKDSKLNISKY